MKKWKQILRRAVSVLSAVAVFTVQVPDLRMKAYAADPVTTMVGEELAAWVFAALAAACGVSIESNVEDLAMDYDYWLNRMQDKAEYKIKFYEGMAAGTYIVGQEAFKASRDFWDSLVAGTYDVIDNGIAVTSDMIDTVAAYFSDNAQTYTPSAVSSYPAAVYNGVYAGPYSFSYSLNLSPNPSVEEFSMSLPAGVYCAHNGGILTIYNALDTDVSFPSHIRIYIDGNLIFDDPGPTTIKSRRFDSWGYHGFWQFFTDIKDLGVKSGASNSQSWILNNLNNRTLSIGDNAALDEEMPWESWEVLDGGKTETGEKAEIIPLYPGNNDSPEDFNKHLADALVAGELLDVLQDVGLRKKGGSVVPTPTTAPDESESPSADPSESPSVDPSEEPSVNPSENPSVNPSENPSVDPSESPSIDPSESPSVDPSESVSIDPSENPDPSGDPDFSLSQFWEGLLNWLNSIVEWPKSIWEAIVSIPGQIIDFFTIKPELIQNAYGDLADVFQGRFSGIRQLGSVFRVSRVFDRTVPYFTMPTPDPFKFAIDTPTIVVLDLRPFEDMFVWVRRILNAILWYAFATWFLNQFDVKLHIG